MSHNKIIVTGLCALLVLSGSCRKSENPVKIQNGSAKSFGTFQISVKVQEGITTLLGMMYDGPTPSNIIWEEVQTAGALRLLKPRVPFCSQTCASGWVCVENDSCQQEPTPISVGTVTVSGVKTSAGTTFTMDHINYYYQPVGVSLDYPGFAEGDPITLSAAGSESSAAFTLSAKGISPLVLLTDTIPCIDGQPINVKWEPPAQQGNTKISILIDITYHGGTKAKIEGECDDNGSLTIPASMMDKLKTFGISGYPKIEISRRAVSSDTAAKAQLVLESKVTRFMVIPGIISCSVDAQCPQGEYCAGDQRCRQK